MFKIEDGEEEEKMDEDKVKEETNWKTMDFPIKNALS